MGKKNKNKNKVKLSVIGGGPSRPRYISPPKVKIMVGMPIHHYIEPYTWMCLGDTTAELAKQGIAFLHNVPVGIPDVAKARNKCVESFMEDKSFTHLMWIDADMVWSPEAVTRLLSHDVPIVSALVTRKGPPFDVTIFQILQNEEGFPDTYNVPFGEFPLDRPFKYKNSGIGTAFMLIKREVMEKVNKPCFAGFLAKSKNGKPRELKGTDYFFCTQVMLAGYDFLYDPIPRIYHIGKGIYGVEDHIAFLDKQTKEGAQVCQLLSTSAKDVVAYKRSFSGPDPSLREEAADAVATQLKLSAAPEESKSETSSCQSSSEDDQTNPQKKTGIDPPRSQKPEDNSPSSIPPNKSDTPTTSDVEPERKAGNDP